SSRSARCNVRDTLVSTKDFVLGTLISAAYARQSRVTCRVAVTVQARQVLVPVQAALHLGAGTCPGAPASAPLAPSRLPLWPARFRQRDLLSKRSDRPCDSERPD